MLTRPRLVSEAHKFFWRKFWPVLALTTCLWPGIAQGGNLKKPPLTAAQIVAIMVSRNEARATALKGYVGRRVYKLQYRGFPGDRSAQMVVEVRYTSPADKKFAVISESGSKFMINHVLKRLLSSEREAQRSRNRREIALTPKNYRFQLLGKEITGQDPLYVLAVHPKVKNKFVYSGKVWIDATDFAVVRIEAEPAKNPSFWISHTHIEQKYAKFGFFWLPVQNTSTSKIRILHGTATLWIEYQNYALNGNPGAGETSVHVAKTF